MSSALPTPVPAPARIAARPRRSPEPPARGQHHGVHHGVDEDRHHGGGLQGALQGQHYGPLWFVQVTANDHSGHATSKPRRSGLAIQGSGQTSIGRARTPVPAPPAPPTPTTGQRPRPANHGLGVGVGPMGPRPVSSRIKRRTLKLLAVDRSPTSVTASAKTNNILNHAGAVHFKSSLTAPLRADRRSASTSSSSSSGGHRAPSGTRVDAVHTRVSVRGSVTGSMSGSRTMAAPSAHRDSFHGAMCPALMVAQCFALLPVDGISRNHPGVPQFRWLSFRVFYTVAVFTGTGVVALLAAYRMISEGLSFNSSVTVVFFGNSLSAMVLFLQLATRWPAVARAWARIEYDMRAYGYPRHLGRKIKIMTAIVLLLATVEHLLAVMTAVYTSWPCYKSGGFTGLIRGYSLNNFAMVLQVTEYAPWKAAFVFLLNVVATFSWNYTDLFIMLLSVSLAQRFKQLNHRLRALQGKNLPSGVWRQLRETYNSLACLTRTVDEAVNNIVLLSFASNLYFICVQLLQGMKLIMDVYPYVYFFFSFGYLLLRTCVVSLYAASIHDESKEPRRVLYSVPTESFCSEVRRFLAQVTTDDVALTGCNFFSVTRSLMLTVAGTIVTYEIVLVQFQGVSGDGSSEPTAKAPNITVRCF